VRGSSRSATDGAVAHALEARRVRGVVSERRAHQNGLSFMKRSTIREHDDEHEREMNATSGKSIFTGASWPSSPRAEKRRRRSSPDWILSVGTERRAELVRLDERAHDALEVVELHALAMSLSPSPRVLPMARSPSAS